MATFLNKLIVNIGTTAVLPTTDEKVNV